MSEFKCEVVRVQIEAHPNADAIEIAKIGDYQSIVRKGTLKTGDLAIYIPEAAVVPEWLLRSMGLWDEVRGKGGLAGSAGNRVKAIKLRGILSQGLIHPAPYDKDNGCYVVDGCQEDAGRDSWKPVVAGDDMAEFLGIVKYEPPIPSHMVGRTLGADFGATHGYDFNNLKKTPSLFDDGEDVVITEKIHGTLMCVSVVPTANANEKYYKGRVIITSKGMGANGLILDHNDETNLYAQTAKRHNLMEAMLIKYGELADSCNRPILLFGEVFGKTASGAGVQDLTYTGETLDYRAFDICFGNRGSELFLDWAAFSRDCVDMCIWYAPLLYRGPYSKQIVLAHTDGQTTLGKCIREGVVVKSATEDRNRHYGRKIAKSVSEAYLMRKGETTELQ